MVLTISEKRNNIVKSIHKILNHLKIHSRRSPSIYDSMRHVLNFTNLKFNMKKGIIADDK